MEYISSNFQVKNYQDIQHQWRKEDIAHRLYQDIRGQRDDHAEQLRSISNVAALIAGFSVIVLVEQSVPDETPVVLVTFLALTGSMTVCLMTLCFVSCTMILAGLMKSFDIDRFDLRQYKGKFLNYWNAKCDKQWKRAILCFTAGIPCFLCNITLSAVVKFQVLSSEPWIVVVTITTFTTGLWAIDNYPWAKLLMLEQSRRKGIQKEKSTGSKKLDAIDVV